MMKLINVLFLVLSTLACQSPTPQNEDTTQLNTDTMSVKIDDSIAVDTAYLTGRFDPAKHPDFVEIDLEHADRAGLLLRKETYAAFKEMYDAAKADGIDLVIRSAARNFYAQKAIWEAKWSGERILDSGENAKEAFPDPADRALKILEYSSMPGTSRHHWGTDIDLNMFTNDWFASGEGKKVYDWLVAHADEFGFCQVYTEIDEDRPYGYQEEKWHWSYLPLAKSFTDQYAATLSDEMVHGFLGAEVAPKIGVVEKYVLGIDPSCR